MGEVAGEWDERGRVDWAIRVAEVGEKRDVGHMPSLCQAGEVSVDVPRSIVYRVFQIFGVATADGGGQGAWQG